MEMQTGEVQIRQRHRGGDGFLRRYQGKTELAVDVPGDDIRVRMYVYSGSNAQQNRRPSVLFPSQLVEHFQLVEVVDDDVADAAFQGLSQFVGRFIVPVEKGVLQGEVDRLINAYLPTGNDVDSQTFFFNQVSHGAA